MSAIIEENLFANTSSDAGREIPAFAGRTGGGRVRPLDAGREIPAFAGRTGGGAGHGVMGAGTASDAGREIPAFAGRTGELEE